MSGVANHQRFTASDGAGEQHDVLGIHTEFEHGYCLGERVGFKDLIGFDVLAEGKPGEPIVVENVGFHLSFFSLSLLYLGGSTSVRSSACC